MRSLWWSAPSSGRGFFSCPVLLPRNCIPLRRSCSYGWWAGSYLFGALSLAELGSIYPGTGGLCTYLQHVYGPLPAFLYAWALLLMIHTGSIAALAVAFGIFVRSSSALEHG